MFPFTEANQLQVIVPSFAKRDVKCPGCFNKPLASSNPLTSRLQLKTFYMSTQGSYTFSETNFQDFSRTQIDFPRALKFALLFSQDLNANSPYCLTYSSYLLAELNRFPELSRTSGLFPGLFSPKNARTKFQHFPVLIQTLSTAKFSFTALHILEKRFWEFGSTSKQYLLA